MNLTYDEALAQLRAWTTTPSLLNHARAIEVVMGAAASQYGGDGADQLAWRITGLLHDADYEKWPEDHPHRIVAWLRERGEEAVAYAILTHNTRLGFPPEHRLDKALLACDELTGLITACCLVRPEGVASLKPKSVKKKLKDKAFAAKIDRGEIRHGVELLGVEMDDHVRFVIDALRPHADELGIAGRGE